MISDELALAMAAFDDQALATLANTGLLRRAQRDLDKGKAELTGVDGDTAKLSIDGAQVTIGVAGPAQASCDCSAAGTCRHRLAAALLLRSLATAEENTDSNEEAVDEPTDPLEWLSAITLDAARKFAGRPGWRAALEIVAEASAVEASETSIAVRFDILDEAVLILRGQGMEGIVSKASKARRKSYHAAALLAARDHLGLPIETAEDQADAPAPSKSGLPSLPDPQFLERVRDNLEDCIQLGFNLAPLTLEESLFQLSVSSRADALPRLSAILRAIAAQMRLRRQRSFEFDASGMLELVASAYALSHAVQREGLELAEYVRLAGETRRSYTQLTDIELVGCGAEVWRSGTGARGVTGHFFAPEAGAFYSVALARGAGQDPAFVPREAYAQHSIWQAGTLETMAHAHIRLHGAGVADGGRLSSGKNARAEVLSAGATPDPDWPQTHSHWPGLQDDLANRFGLGVEANGQPQMALIRPSQVARPQFDELAQQLVWPVMDADGRWIALTIDHDEQSQWAIAEVEKQIQRKWHGIMLVRAEQVGEGLSLSPVTLFDGPKPIDLTLLRPAFDWRGKKIEKPDILGWLQRLRPDPGKALQMAQQTRSDQAVIDAWRHLLDRLEAGASLARMLDEKTAATAARLTDYGLANVSGRVAKLLGNSQGNAAALKAAYALLVARQQRRSLPYLA